MRAVGRRCDTRRSCGVTQRRPCGRVFFCVRYNADLFVNQVQGMQAGGSLCLSVHMTLSGGCWVLLPRARASFTPSDAFHTCCPLYGRPAWCRVYGMLPPPPPYALPRPADSWLPQNRHPDMVERLMLLCPAGLPVRGYSANMYMTLIHSAKSLLELPFVGESVTKYVLLCCRYPWPGFGVHATACGHNGPA